MGKVSRKTFGELIAKIVKAEKRSKRLIVTMRRTERLIMADVERLKA